MQLFNSEKKIKRKKDIEAFYYDENDNFIPVPSIYEKDKTLILNFLKECLRVKYPKQKNIKELIDQFWNEGMEKKKDIIEGLEQIKAEHENAGDKPFQVKAYSWAIRNIKFAPIPILSYDQALKISGVGKGIAANINEILKHGKLKTQEERVESSLKHQIAIESFTKVWGVNQKIANEWYSYGIHELSDLKKGEIKLTEQQKVGLKYYYDLLEPIPREEVEETSNEITRILKKEIDKSITTCICGSYRSGISEIDEIVMVITRKDNTKPRGTMREIYDVLKKNKIIVTAPIVKADTLACIIRSPNSINFSKVHIHFIPHKIFGVRVLWCTGPKSYIKQLQDKALLSGFKLTSKGLFDTSGDNVTIVETPNEKSVFEKLGIEYVEPKDRR